MTVTEDEIVNDYDDKLTFGIVHKRPAAIIIPYQENKFTLIKQYRYAVDYLSWEFPAGHMEGNSVLKTAKQELEEESGLVASNIKEIGKFYIAPGHLTQICHVFLATELSAGQRHLEKAEKGMISKEFTYEDVNKMVKNTIIMDGLTISAFKIYEEYIK